VKGVPFEKGYYDFPYPTIVRYGVPYGIGTTASQCPDSSRLARHSETGRIAASRQADACVSRHRVTRRS